MLRDVVHADRDERALCFQVLHIHLVGNILEGKRLAAGLAGTGQTLGNFREDAADMLLIVLILRDGTECFIHPYEFAGNRHQSVRKRQFFHLRFLRPVEIGGKFNDLPSDAVIPVEQPYQ